MTGDPGRRALNARWVLVGWISVAIGVPIVTAFLPRSVGAGAYHALGWVALAVQVLFAGLVLRDRPLWRDVAISRLWRGMCIGMVATTAIFCGDPADWVAIAIGLATLGYIWHEHRAARAGDVRQRLDAQRARLAEQPHQSQA